MSSIATKELHVMNVHIFASEEARLAAQAAGRIGPEDLTLTPDTGADLYESLVEATAPRTVDVGAAARSLVGKVDAIYTNTDNNVVSAYEALVKVGIDAKVPLIASDTDSVVRGAIAAVGIDYRDLGVQTGRMAVRILKGEKAGEIASESSENLQLFVNPGAAQRQGVTLDPAFIQSAAKVIE